ncbi:hypothetical protein ZWY2020_046475 [Hordeum vulgare]|nr:hypothetical protein ZWY2020_046475 [Hordeum vulgare]
MYGGWARDLVVQISVVQIIVYFPLLLLAFEVRRACGGGAGKPDAAGAASASDDGVVEDGGVEEEAARAGLAIGESGLVQGGAESQRVRGRPRGRMVVRHKQNPVYFDSSRPKFTINFLPENFWWHIVTPRIIEGSVLIMSRTGVGLAMFSMGLFMALQEKIIVCGAGLTALGMALRFVAGPAATAAGAVALGLRGDVLRLAIIQAALPQSITTFVFAKEYGLHADVLSTAVIFGTLASLPVLIVYYIVLGFVG